MPVGSPAVQVGVDTGGTFTDVVGDDGRIAKVPSTPGDLAAGVSAGIDVLAGATARGRPALLAHGTTVATNALLERKGGRVALVTTAVNAYLRPACRRYLRKLGDHADEVLVLTSAGGLVPVGEAVDRPVALLLSGPAGGVRAAAAAAVASGFPDAVTFDMGGTSTDVCLVRGGAPAPAAQRSVGGYPIRLPALDIHTIGAGGGSIARIDAGGA